MLIVAAPFVLLAGAGAFSLRRRGAGPTSGCWGSREQDGARRGAPGAALATSLGRRPAVEPSGLYGTVLRGPSPRLSSRCSLRRAGPNARFVLVRNGKASRVRTNASGRYRARLAPGRYAVRKLDWGPGSITPAAVRVVAGRFRRVNLFIDTGIR